MKSFKNKHVTHEIRRELAEYSENDGDRKGTRQRIADYKAKYSDKSRISSFTKNISSIYKNGDLSPIKSDKTNKDTNSSKPLFQRSASLTKQSKLNPQQLKNYRKNAVNELLPGFSVRENKMLDRSVLQDVPYRMMSTPKGEAHIVCLSWPGADAEGELKKLKEALRTLKYDVIMSVNVTLSELEIIKEQWKKIDQKTQSFIAIVLGASDLDQNFITKDNKVIPYDTILSGWERWLPKGIPKLFFFNSFIPSAAEEKVGMPKHTLLIHTYVDSRLPQMHVHIAHPYVIYLLNMLNNQKAKTEIQELILKSKNYFLAESYDYYKAVNIRCQNTLVLPLFLSTLKAQSSEQRNQDTMSFSLEQGYPIRGQVGTGLAVVCTVADANWSNVDKCRALTLKNLTEICLVLEDLSFDIITYELNHLTDYRNSMLNNVKKLAHNYDIVVCIILGISRYIEILQFPKDNSEITIDTITQDLSQVCPPNIPKLVIISQSLQMDPRRMKSNFSKYKPKIPEIRDSYFLFTKTVQSRYLESTFLHVLTKILESKFSKLEFTNMIAQCRFESHKMNLLSNFLEANNLERPLYFMPEELMLSAELLARGDEFANYYQEACEQGTETLRFFRLMVVGPEGVGKTSLLRALTGKEFRSDETSTPFIDKFDVQIHKISNDWKENQDLDAYADNLMETKMQMAVNYVVNKINKSQIKADEESSRYADGYDDVDSEEDTDINPLSFTSVDDDFIEKHFLFPQDICSISKDLCSVTAESQVSTDDETNKNYKMSVSSLDQVQLEETASEIITTPEKLIPDSSKEDNKDILPPITLIPPKVEHSGPIVLSTKINTEAAQVEAITDSTIPITDSTTPIIDCNACHELTGQTTGMQCIDTLSKIPAPPPDLTTVIKWKELLQPKVQVLKENLIDVPISRIHETLEQGSDKMELEHPDFLTAWDFAGQNYLYCFHSLFLSPRAIYLLLIDLSVDDLSKSVLQRQERKDRLYQRSEIGVPESYLQVIAFWLNAIYSVARMHVSEHYRRHSKVIFVFSRADRCENPQERARAHTQTIHDYINGRTNAGCLIYQDDEPLIISCLPDSPYFSNLATLKDLMREISKTVAFKQEIPIRWLELARAILKERSPFISTRRLELLCEQNSCTWDFQYLVSLFHDIGFFYYQKGIIIRDIQTFLNIVYHIISPQYGEKMLISAQEYEKVLLEKDLKICRDEGKMTYKLLDKILSSDEDLTPVKDEVIKLLLMYGVIIDAEADMKNPFYYVPYLLTGHLSTLTEILDEDDGESKDIITQYYNKTFYLYFPDGFIPAAVYFSLLSFCLKLNKKKGQSEPILGFDCCRFLLSDEHYYILDFCTNKHYIRILFLSKKNSHFVKFERIDFLHFLQTHISQIQGGIIPCGNAAKIALECPCQELFKIDKMVQPCVFLDQLLSSQPGNRTSWCHVDKKYRVWNDLFIDNDFYFDTLVSRFKNQDIAEFIFKHREEFKTHIDIKKLSRGLYFSGLINANDLYSILSGQQDEQDEDTSILNHLPHKSDYWAIRFYLCLRQEITSAGHMYLSKMLESYLVELNQKVQKELVSKVEDHEAKKKFRNKDLGFSSQTLDENFDRYQMNKNPHGIAVIVNIEYFEGKPKMTRRGSHFDFIQLRETFEELQYIVFGFENLTRLQFKKQLAIIRKMDHKNYDSFVCVVMSHGDEDDNVVMHDLSFVSKIEITSAFSPNQCPSLVEKPKIFIFQACRGAKAEAIPEPTLEEHDYSLTINETNQEGNTYFADEYVFIPNLNASGNDIVDLKMPNSPVHELQDTFIGNSTVLNYVSYRDPSKGSMFVQSFCKVIRYTRYEEFQHVMNEVRRRVSLLSKTHVQCTEDLNHLTKKLYFF